MSAVESGYWFGLCEQTRQYLRIIGGGKVGNIKRITAKGLQDEQPIANAFGGRQMYASSDDAVVWCGYRQWVKC